MEGCPSHEALSDFAESGEPNGDVRHHVERCEACRAIVADMREDVRFLSRFRAAGVVVASPTSDPALDPDLVEGYQIVSEICRGGQGIVYKAIQTDTRREVAIKILLHGRIAGDRRRFRFEQEMALAASLRHPNIVAVHDSVHTRDGRVGFAMEYVRGHRLDEWARGQENSTTRPGLTELVQLFVKVCGAVQYAHRRGIIHRDLKPGNILVDVDGEPRLCDFGVAKIVAGGGAPTRTGEFVGTFAYAAPEQVSGSPDQIDTRSDVYSLGVVLYELVVGTMPYPVDGSVSEVVRSITTASPRPPLEAGAHLRADLETIVLKALAKEPERRYQSAQRLAEDLTRFLSGEAIEARRSSGWYMLRKTVRRYRLSVSVATGVLVLVLVFAVVAWTQAASLRVELSKGNIDRGRARTQLGNIPEAESLLWTELLMSPQGVEHWDPDDSRLPLSRAWWALWELYATHPCIATVRTSGPTHPGGVKLLLPVPGRDDLVLISGSDETMGLWTLPNLVLTKKSTPPAESGQSVGSRGFLAAAFTRQGEIVTVTSDSMVRRWNAMTLEPQGRPYKLPPRIPAATYSPSLSADGGLLGISDTSVIWLMDPSTGTVLEAITSTSGAPVELGTPIFSSDRRWIAYAEHDGITTRPIGALVAATHAAVKANGRVRGIAFDTSCHTEQPRVFLAAGGEVFTIDQLGSGVVQRFAAVDRASNLHRIAISTDGQRLAVVGVDGRLSLWDTHAAPGTAALRYFAAHDAPAIALTFSAGDRELLSGHADGVVKRWNCDRPPNEQRGGFTPLRGHTNTVFAVAVSGADGDLRGYSGAYDHTVRAWDLRTGQESAHSAPLGGRVESIALSRDGETVAAAIDLGDDSDVILLDAATLCERARIAKAHTKRCTDLAFSPNGATLATVGDDGLVRLWDLATRGKKAQRRLPIPRSVIRLLDVPARTVRFSPQGDKLGWGGGSGVVNVADGSLTMPSLELPGSRQTMRSVRFSPDGRALAGAGDDSVIRIWDASTGRSIQEMKGHNGLVFALAYSPNGQLLASGGADGTVRLWDAATGDNLAILRDEPPGYSNDVAIFALTFNSPGDSLMVGGNEGYLGVWDLRHFDRHIAGNMEYWLDRLKESGRPSPMDGAAKRWAEVHKRAKHGED